jgi:RecA-family ATPase
MDFYDAKSAELITQEIEKWSETAGNPVLIVIDTLARNFNGDENAASDMGKFINNVNQYLRAPFECVVLIVHHSGHSQKNRARGSTALRAGIDFEYRVEKDKNEKKGKKDEKFVTNLTCTKMKDAVEPKKTQFKGREMILNFPERGEEVMTSLVFKKTKVVKQEKPLKSELIQFLELANNLANSEGVVNRKELREQAVDNEIANDFVQVRSYIQDLRNKNIIEGFEGEKKIRLLE